MPIKEVGNPVLSPESQSREKTVRIDLAPGSKITDLLLTDGTVFRTQASDVFGTSDTEIFKFTVDVADSGSVLEVTALEFNLNWITKVNSPPTAAAETFWQVGAGAVPLSWRQLTKKVPTTDEETEHSVSGNFIPEEAGNLPFTVRLMGRLIAAGPSLSTDILSRSTVTVTYKVLP